MSKTFRKIYSLEDLQALPLDSIVGKESQIYQRYQSDEEAIGDNIVFGPNNSPGVWLEPQCETPIEWASSEIVWHCLTGSYETLANDWCWVYYE
jgi:hypothetical protein